MVPRTYPSSLSSTGRRRVVASVLSSISGLQRWVDYIPVKFSTSETTELNSTGGSMALDFLSSTTGKQAWVDYIPVYIDTLATDAWSVSAVGFIPCSMDTNPTLSLDFTASTLDSRISYTRAGNKTYFDSTGTLQTAVINEWPVEYDPTTLEPLGRSAWEQRTNSIRNNTMQGAVVGVLGSGGGLPTNWAHSAPVGVTVSVVSIGTESGIDYIDVRFQGTAATIGSTIRFDTNTGIAAASGQAWSSFAYFRLIGGSLTNVTENKLTLYGNDAGGAAIETTDSVFVPTSSSLRTQKVVAVRTMNNASTANAVIKWNMQVTTGVPFDYTIRIGLPQLELGAYATPVIKTTGTAATRSADIITVTGSNFSSWYNQTEGTFVTDGSGQQTATNNILFATASDGTASNRLQMYVTGTNNVGAQLADGGSLIFALTALAGASANTRYKLATAYKTGDSAASCNGLTPVSSAGAFSITEIDRLTIGARQDGIFQLNGWIRSIKYYNTRLPNASLQALTK